MLDVKGLFSVRSPNLLQCGEPRSRLDASLRLKALLSWEMKDVQLDCDTLFQVEDSVISEFFYCMYIYLYFYREKMHLSIICSTDPQASTPCPLTPWRARASWRCAAPSAATWSAWRWRAEARP